MLFLRLTIHIIYKIILKAPRYIWHKNTLFIVIDCRTEHLAFFVEYHKTHHASSNFGFVHSKVGCAFFSCSNC